MIDKVHISVAIALAERLLFLSQILGLFFFFDDLSELN